MQQSNGTRWERPDAPLGTLVYRAGLLSKEKLESALQEGQRTGRRLGEILLQKGWIDEKDLARLLAGQKGLQFVSLKGRGYEQETARLLPERICRYHTAVAMEASAERVLVAIADPTDDSAVQEIRDEIGRQVELVVAPTSEIRSALDEVFGSTPAPAVLTPAVTPVVATSPVGDLGLRIAAPPSAPEPEDDVLSGAAPEAPADEAEPVSEPEQPAEPVEPVAPVADLEAPVADEAPTSEPEPVSEPLVVVVPETVAVEPAAEPEQPPEPAPSFVLPTLGSSPAEPVVPAPVEPTIERNEDAHVSVAFNTPAPVEQPQPEAEEPLPVPTLDADTPEPEPEPEPEAAAPVADAPVSAPPPMEAAYRLVLNLDGGEEADVGYFADPAEATAAARALVAGMKDGEWPQVDRKFFPPDRITSVEIRERQRFTGSQGRATWGSDGPA
jgi:hypothetical protein